MRQVQRIATPSGLVSSIVRGKLRHHPLQILELDKPFKVLKLRRRNAKQQP